MMTSLVLTDDEVLAVIQRWEVPWHGALPTVHIDDEEDVARAIVRGWRALLVRGLLAEDRKSMLQDIQMAIAERPALSAASVNALLQLDGRGPLQTVRVLSATTVLDDP